MKNVIIPKKKSLEVRNFAQIEDEVKDLHHFLLTYKSPSKQVQTHYAIHHSQVSETPFNFFVIAPFVIGAPDNQICVIVNPKIVEKYKETKTSKFEGCMSFPFRSDRIINRYEKVKVSYQIPDEKGENLIAKEEDVVGIMAYIFQHEVEHSHGNHIYKKK